MRHAYRKLLAILLSALMITTSLPISARADVQEPGEVFQLSKETDLGNYTVTFLVDDAQVTQATGVAFGAAADTLAPAANPTKAGYTFEGWRSAEGEDIASVSVMRDTAFYAQFSADLRA